MTARVWCPKCGTETVWQDDGAQCPECFWTWDTDGGWYNYETVVR
jgi:hypothetical protein